MTARTAPSTGPSSLPSAGRWRSRSSAASMPMTPSSSAASRPRPRPWPGWSTPSSCRSTTTGATRRRLPGHALSAWRQPALALESGPWNSQRARASCWTRSPAPWPPPTCRASSTATSSRPTSCWTRPATPICPTSASPRIWTASASSTAAGGHHRHPGLHLAGADPGRADRPRRPTSTAWARCSMRR